jgi:hypothetical protein
MSTINDAIHAISMHAYNSGLEAGRQEALHETFTTLELILNDIWEYYYDYAAQREAVCKIQGRVEELKDKLNAQNG